MSFDVCRVNILELKMLSRPKVSVIVPAHNEEGYIRRTIDSYANQSTPHELIVVANGCTDDTTNVAHDLGAKVIELENPSIPAAKNAGVKQAEGDYLIFNDADTIAAPNYVESVVETLNESVGYGAARAKAENWKPSTLTYIAMLNFGSVILREACGNMFVKRDHFEDVNGFDETLLRGEDTALSITLREHGSKFAALWKTYTIPSARAASLKRTIKDSFNYLNFLVTGNLKE